MRFRVRRIGIVWLEDARKEADRGDRFSVAHKVEFSAPFVSIYDLSCGHAIVNGMSGDH